ncbi:MAG: hypothetical protein ABGY75_02195 [Gemmataceae bacterium]
MHTSGLVLTLAPDPAVAAAAEQALTAAGPFTLGPASGSRRAATLEVADPKAAHDWHEWAAALAGVIAVEVVFVHWDDVEQEVSHAGA